MMPSIPGRLSHSPPALVPQASSAPATALDASSTAADVIAHFSTSLVGKNILVTGEFQKSFPQFSEELEGAHVGRLALSP